MAAKSHIIVEVSHEAIEENTLTRDKYKDIVQVLYLHPSPDKAVVQFNELLEKYPKEKYDIKYIKPCCVQIFDIQKVSSWTGAYRKNTLIKTIAICEYAVSAVGQSQ